MLPTQQRWTLICTRKWWNNRYCSHSFSSVHTTSSTWTLHRYHPWQYIVDINILILGFITDLSHCIDNCWVKKSIKEWWWGEDHQDQVERRGDSSTEEDISDRGEQQLQPDHLSTHTRDPGQSSHCQSWWRGGGQSQTDTGQGEKTWVVVFYLTVAWKDMNYSEWEIKNVDGLLL